MVRIREFLRKRPPAFHQTVGLLSVAVVGLADYLTGPNLSLMMFYLMIVCLGGWFIGPRYGILLGVLSTVSWLVANHGPRGAPAHAWISYWNALAMLGCFLLVIWLVRAVRRFHDHLEQLVAERTAALAAEMTERTRLEKSILETADREQSRIGQDLHDSLSQQLTATMLAAKVLEEQLTGQNPPAATQAKQIADSLRGAIAEVRDVARGLSPVNPEADGLGWALRGLAATTARAARIDCEFADDPPVLIVDSTVATHLYRIAQEAVTNAIKHGKPTRLLIRLAVAADGLALTVQDNGMGLADGSGRGLGLQTMRYRAQLIGAALEIKPDPDGGTVVRCRLKPPAVAP